MNSKILTIFLILGIYLISSVCACGPSTGINSNTIEIQPEEHAFKDNGLGVHGESRIDNEYNGPNAKRVVEPMKIIEEKENFKGGNLPNLDKLIKIENKDKKTISEHSKRAGANAYKDLKKNKMKKKELGYFYTKDWPEYLKKKLIEEEKRRYTNYGEFRAMFGHNNSPDMDRLMDVWKYCLDKPVDYWMVRKELADEYNEKLEEDPIDKKEDPTDDWESVSKKDTPQEKDLLTNIITELKYIIGNLFNHPIVKQIRKVFVSIKNVFSL